MIEGTAGVRDLIRVDTLMLWSLYGLTFLEFLFPQPDVEARCGGDVFSLLVEIGSVLYLRPPIAG
jgi:hypothetical protein